MGLGEDPTILTSLDEQNSRSTVSIFVFIPTDSRVLTPPHEDMFLPQMETISENYDQTNCGDVEPGLNGYIYRSLPQLRVKYIAEEEAEKV